MKFKKALLINISDNELDRQYLDKLSELCDEVTSVKKDDPTTIDQLKDTDCILIGFATPLTKEMIDAAPELKYIGVFANGYDLIDIKYAAGKNIPVCNLQGVLTESVAEFTIAAILDFSRRISIEKARGKSGDFEYREDHIMDSLDLFGANFGIVGLGHIGSRVAEIANAFGSNVTYWSLHKKNVNYKYLDLDELIKSADIISINTSLNSETEGILSRERLMSIKSNSIVIIVAPIELVDLDALADRLAKNDITFISDHAELMKPEDIAKISKYDNCILYPPVAPVTRAVKQNKQTLFVSNVEGFLNNKVVNRVN